MLNIALYTIAALAVGLGLAVAIGARRPKVGSGTTLLPFIPSGNKRKATHITLM